ncbi:GNAT family N-acetyltransferase [Microbacterium sp. NPDC056234]|uniref:GNAT family N-acetyltransferase n=1 Tax=Microbacterium sp. NPDC056234 TaxID=3345757 RepID=UPI0035D54DE3
MTGVLITKWDGDEAELTRAAELYARVFAEQPYREEVEASRTSFMERIRRYGASKPHLRLVLAKDGADVVGLALGTGIAAGDWWRDRIAPLLEHDARARWFGDGCFSVMELAVALAHRRSGIAANLMDALLKDLPYATAVLSRYAEAEDAGRFYASLGWREIATGIRIGDSPALCVLARDLR